MIARRLPECPLCGAEFAPKYLHFDAPFRCPDYQEYLLIPRWYLRAWWITSVVVSAGIWYNLDLGEHYFIVATVASVLPVGFIIMGYLRYFLPPRLKPSSSPDGGTPGLNSK